MKAAGLFQGPKSLLCLPTCTHSWRDRNHILSLGSTTAPAAWGAAEIEPRPPPGRTHWAGPAPPRTRPPPPRGLLESSPGDSFLGQERSGCLGEETRGLLPPSERRRKPRHQLEIISSKILALKYTRLEQDFSDYNVHVIIWPWC